MHYFLTDHLGSTRVVAKVTPTGREDLDRKDYYPFGKTWEQPDMPASDNRYTFSGKEFQQTYSSSALYLDFGARFYDPDGVVFIQQDPLLEKYYSIGQYNTAREIRLIESIIMERNGILIKRNMKMATEKLEPEQVTNM